MKDDKLYLIHMASHNLPELKAKVEMMLRELNDG